MRYRYPGLFGEDRFRGIWIAVAVSVVLHAALFAAFGRFHIRKVDRTFYAPLHMVNLAGERPGGGSGGGAPEPEPAPEPAPAPEPPAPAKAARKAESEAVEVTREAPKPKPKPKPEPKAEPTTRPRKTAPEPAPEPETETIPAAPAEPAPPEPPTESRVAERIARIREKLGAPAPEADREPAPQASRKLEGEKVRGAVESIRQRLGERTGAGSGTGAGAGTGSEKGAVGVRGGGNVLQQVRLRSYYNRLWEHVNSHWAIPPSLQGRDFTVIVSAVLDRRGRVLDSWVEDSSGSEAYDQSALRALERAAPLPPIPDAVPDEVLEVGFRFHGE